MSQKTIQINPELFKLSRGNKTRKNRDKKELSIEMNPIGIPNNLKTKLLNRIKQHKSKELQQHKHNSSLKDTTTKSNSTTSSSASTNQTDEFTNALTYLTELNKKQKQPATTTKIPQSNIMTNNKTLKQTYTHLNGSFDYPVSLEIPKELLVENTTPIGKDIFNINYHVDDSVPYGCLKNGKKKTYKQWKELLQSPVPNSLSTSVSASLGLDVVRPPTPPRISSTFVQPPGHVSNNFKAPTSTSTSIPTSIPVPLVDANREERLKQIKNKLKRLEDKETQKNKKVLDELTNIQEQILNPEGMVSKPTYESILEKEDKDTPKNIFKKTIKRKYTLGRCKDTNTVSILINNRDTRKNMVDTCNELKKTDINDVRKYLRQHGLVKVGTTCPPDILRKTFEFAMLSGEVRNTNNDTILHNLMHSENNT